MTEPQAWVLLALAAISAVIAMRAVTVGRQSAVRRATLGLMRDYNASPEVGRALKILRDPDRRNFSLEGRDREDFLFLMNMFEMLAVGLGRGIYDKKMIVLYFGRDLKGVWELAAPFVRHIREFEKDRDAFTEFEKLADRIRSETGTRVV